MGSPPRIYCLLLLLLLLFIFLLEYPAGGSMEKRATVTYKLSDFTIK